MEKCPCGRKVAYEECCGAIISGKRMAQTAEDLMRSRYSAFVNREIDYIINTYAPETRPIDEHEEIAEWAASVHWEGLEVIATQKGGEADGDGTVEFKAHFSEKGIRQILHENSFFRKEGKQWLYVTGEYPKAQPKKGESLPERNAPCPCGSGKKYKKCCM